MMPYKRRQQHLGEVDGLNTGGQLRRGLATTLSDDDEENAERSAWPVTRAHRSRQPKRPHRNEAGALQYEADAHDNARARKEREGSAG